MHKAEEGGRLTGVARAAEWVGLAGGLLSLGVGLLVSVSVIGRKFFDQGVPGDFEFVKMGAALTVFFFLPACQARRGNIIVDTFTGFLGERSRARLDAVWDIVYGLAMAAIGVCMVAGAWAAYATKTTTMVLLLPTWPALALSTMLLFFLSVVCFWTARRLLAGRL
jgi:hypothetical protein